MKIEDSGNQNDLAFPMRLTNRNIPNWDSVATKTAPDGSDAANDLLVFHMLWLIAGFDCSGSMYLASVGMKILRSYRDKERMWTILLAFPSLQHIFRNTIIWIN